MPQITAVNNTIKDTVIGEEEIDQLLSAGVLLSMEDDLAKANSGQLVTESRKIPLADFKLEEKKIEVSKKIEPTNVVPLKTVAPPLKTQAEEILLKQKELAKEKENKIEMTRIEAQKREKEQEADRAIVEDIREKIEAQKQAQATPVILKPSVILKNDETSIQDIRQKAQEEEQKKIEQQKALMLEIRSKAEAERKAKEEELVYLKAQQEKRQEELKQTEKIKVGEIKKQAMPNQSGDIRRKLEQEQEVLTLQLRAFPARKKPVEERLSALKKQKEDLIKVLANLVNRETVQSNKRREIENQEKITTNSDERHKLEKERWLVEENLRQVEKEKWEPGAKLGVLQEKISEIEAELLGFNGVEMELRKKVEEIVWKIKEINLAVEKSRLVKMLEVFDQELSGLNKEKNVYFQTKNELEVKIQEITQKEKDIEDQVNQLEEREKTAVTPEQEKSLEQERWHSDGLRQKIEQERWIEESKRNDFETKIKDVDNRVKGIEDKIYKSKSRIAEIESFLINQGKLTVVQEFKKPEVTKVAQAIQMVKPAIITPPPVMAPVLKPQESIIKAEVKPLGLAPQEAISDEAGIGERKQKEQEIIEKAKQLRTQEVEDKVIAEIRRQARQQEVKEKIAAIQARARQIKQEEVPRGPLAKDIILKKLTGSSLGEEAERGEFLARVAGQEKSFEVKDKEQTQEVVFRPVVRRPSFIEKFLARILIVVFLVAILGIIFFVWKSGFKFNFSPQVNPKATSSENIAPNPELPIKNGIDLAPTSSEDTIINESTSSESIVENNPSADLLSFIKTKILTLGQATDTADLFKIAMTESESVDSLIRVVVKDETSGDYLDDLRVLESLGFILKDEVSSLLNPEGNVFIYYGKQGARLGFIFSTTNKDALQVKMKEWEASLPTDIFSLLNWQAGDQISLASSFKGATKNNRSFRYLDVVPASRDMGVCYGVVGDYFVFTTAGSAMLKVLQILP